MLVAYLTMSHRPVLFAGKQSSLLTPGKGHSPAFASSLARFRSPGAPAKVMA